MPPRKKYCKSTKRKKTKVGKRKKTKSKAKGRKGFPAYCSSFLDFDLLPSISTAPLQLKPIQLPKPSAPPLFIPITRPPPQPKPKPVKVKPERKHAPPPPPVLLRPSRIPVYRPKPKPKPAETILLPTKSLRRGTCETKYQEYQQGKQLGGEFGTAYELCHEQKCPYVIKVQNIFENIPNRSLDDFQQEVYIHRLVYDKFKIAPRLYDAWICVPVPGSVEDPDIVAIGFIVMERMDGDLANLPSDSLTMRQKNGIINVIHSQIDRVHQLGFEHRDIAFHNVFYKRQNGSVRFVLGDFGLARPVGQPRSKEAWDGGDDYKRLKEVDAYLSEAYHIIPSQPTERKQLPHSYVLQGPQINLPMPPLERYPEPSSLGYGETIVPTAFDRPISQAKLEQKYQEEILGLPPRPREEKYNKTLEPIPHPWQPYLHYLVRPKDILDPGSPIWLEISEEDLANLTKQERDYLEEDNTKIEHFPQENIVKYDRRQLGDKIILVYDDKLIRKKLNHVLDNEYLPFASAMSLVNAQSEAERRKNVSSRFVMNILREHPLPPMILKYLDLFANIIAEESIDMKTWNPIHREANPNKSIDYLLYAYDKWFVTIPINGITLYSKSGLMKILDYLKNRDRLWLHGETWGRLQKQIK